MASCDAVRRVRQMVNVCKRVNFIRKDKNDVVSRSRTYTYVCSQSTSIGEFCFSPSSSYSSLDRLRVATDFSFVSAKCLRLF